MLPEPGMIVIFDRVPPGSYLSEGEAYRVRLDGRRHLCFEKADRPGRGSIEQNAMLRRCAIWHCVEEVRQ